MSIKPTKEKMGWREEAKSNQIIGKREVWKREKLTGKTC